MADAETAINYVLRNEGLLEENPNDIGGITKYGLSLRFLKSLSEEKLKSYGLFTSPPTPDCVRQLTILQAQAVYKGEFWTCAPFDKIMSQDITNYIFDMSVNMGVSNAIKCAQRATWAVLKRWENLPDDGVLGTNTLNALQLCGFMLMTALRAERGSYYRNIIANNPSQKEFENGWFNRTYRS